VAYSSSIVIQHGGGRDYTVTITETEAGAATEATIEGLPKKGIITDMKLTKTSGSANTFAPIVVTTSGSSAAVHRICQATAAAEQDNAIDPAAKYITTNGTLYHRVVCDTGSDTTVTTVYFIQAGW